MIRAMFRRSLNTRGLPVDGCFVDATGNFQAEVAVSEGTGHWPSMVQVDLESGSLLSYDARTLGLLPIDRADRADAVDEDRGREGPCAPDADKPKGRDLG